MKKTSNGNNLARVLPIFVWGVAVVGIIALYVQRTSSFQVLGVATSPTVTVTSMQSGIVQSLSVQPYQKVEKGQVLAVLDGQVPWQGAYDRLLLDTQIKTAKAELEQLKAQEVAARQQFAAEYALQADERAFRLRQLRLDVEKNRIDILEIQTQLTPDQILLEELKTEILILQELVEKGAVEDYELQKTITQKRIYEEKINLEKQWLAQSQTDLEFAQNRLVEYESKIPEIVSQSVALLPLQKAIEVQEKRIREFMLPEQNVTVYAPFDGVVSQIQCSSGQAVVAGDPILTITDSTPDHIVVWLDQSMADKVAVNQEVEVVKSTSPRKIIKSKISQVGNMMELMPERLWVHPTQPKWGRPVLIPVGPEMELIPNQLVGIRCF